ncbi:MAG: hypothetical protein OD814_000783 [Candidatus Alkanophagales archaeon MCA70_species_1]|nr:hypothetical protein [Candidatus Alkanophaga volatiphilum]
MPWMSIACSNERSVVSLPPNGCPEDVNAAPILSTSFPRIFTESLMNFFMPSDIVPKCVGDPKIMASAASKSESVASFTLFTSTSAPAARAPSPTALAIFSVLPPQVSYTIKTFMECPPRLARGFHRRMGVGSTKLRSPPAQHKAPEHEPWARFIHF